MPPILPCRDCNFSMDNHFITVLGPSLTFSSEMPLYKGETECEGCSGSLTYPSLIPHITSPSSIFTSWFIFREGRSER